MHDLFHSLADLGIVTDAQALASKQARAEAEAQAERTALLAALNRHCTCESDNGMLHAVCAGHQALLDPMFVRHMSFGRYLAKRCDAEEFAEQAA